MLWRKRCRSLRGKRIFLQNEKYCILLQSLHGGVLGYVTEVLMKLDAVIAER